MPHIDTPLAPLQPLSIVWPAGHSPAESAVFVSNQTVIPAPPERVWAWLIRAALWPKWYPNSSDMHFQSHAGPDLRERTRFRWKTFGIKVTSKVYDFEPCQRLAWNADGIGIHAWHAWLLTPQPDGSTHVLTEETQNGWLARLGKALMPNRMAQQHQIWLETLSRQAKSGPPPTTWTGSPTE